MYLQRIEMQGFKTFANRTVLEFLPPKDDNRGVTGIVGPNGSGKSNIADAVRWVLGEQSLKLLRGKKSEDVIFSGSEKRARSGFAEVSLTLNNEDGSVADVEFAEVTITRRLYRDGESEYLINKSKVRLQDVLLLLAKANFGTRTYSVIGQGMIDAVLIASPRERKEFFDEAAGVKQYQLKREAAVRKLEASEENLKQAELIVGELEPRLRYLSRQVHRLEQRADHEQELRRLEALYFGASWAQLEDEMKVIDERTKTVDGDRRRKETEIQKVRQELSGLETEETKTEGLLALQKEYEKELGRQSALREKELQLKSAIRLEQMKAQAASGPALPMPLPQIIEEVEEISRRHEQLVAKLGKIKSLDEAKVLAGELESLSKDVAEFLAELREPGHKNKAEKKEPVVPAQLQKDLEAVVAEIPTLAKSLAEIQQKMQKWGEDEAKKRGAFFEVQRRLQSLQSELFELDRHLSDHRVERARIETKRDALVAEAHEFLGESADAILRTKPTEPVDTAAIAPKIHQLRTQVAAVGTIDDSVVAEYRESKERFDFLTKQIEDLRATKTSLETMLVELDVVIKKQSDQAFHRINKEFNDYFQKLFGGGHASLHKIEREEEEEEEEAERAAAEKIAAGVEEEAATEKKENPLIRESWLGLDIYANPPGKKVKTINVLSGGERALTSIALICAIMTANPSPFVVLDEVDAALDESNASKFAGIINELSKTAQFLVITHNRYTMHQAQVLYGVTMADDSTSRVLSIKLEEAEKIRGTSRRTVGV